MSWFLGAVNGDAFVSSFCTPEHYENIFQNFLGGLTPCFCDVILLGGAHIMLLWLSVVRIMELRSGRNLYRSVYSVKGVARVTHRVAMITCVALALIPLMQFNARVAQTYSSVHYLRIAPYEIFNFTAGTLAFAAAATAIHRELDTFVPSATWLVRMPLVATFAAEVAKLRGVLLQIEARTQNYFFWLFVAQAVLEAGLALWACTIACPPRSLLDASRELQSAYEMLPSSQLVMDIYDEQKVCPEASAGLLSSITFSWLNPLLRRGYKHALELKDLWLAAPPDRVETLHKAFSRHWREQQQQPRGGGSLAAACWRTTARLFLVAAPFKLANDASQFVAPVSINLLLSAIATQAPAAHSYALAGAMFAGLLLGSVAECQYWQRTMRAGFQLRAVLIAEVYRKIMFLTAGSRTAYSRGFIYNIVTNDTDAVQMTCNQIFSVVSSPLRIVVAMVLLYTQLGAAAFAALVLLICMIPAQMALASVATKILREGMAVSDERTKLEADVITGIEAVKTQAWERPFTEQIGALRSQELAVLWRGFKLQAGNTLLLQTIPTLVTIATFTLYVLLGNDLTAAKAFTALSLFSVLRFPLFQLPMIIQQLTRAGVAFRRLNEFLSCPEQDKLPAAPMGGGSVAARFVGDVTWGPSAAPVLSSVNFTAHRGELVAIVGATGSGKTALLYGLLGLTDHVHGNRIVVKGSTAFVAQQAFIFGGTVQENILFEAPFHADDYDRALTAAGLHTDLEQLPAGDQTELGEGGINVSGGQKQRIAVARAVYAAADVYLLDDPLSALDSKVGRHVFRACITGELAGRTRILVTNQLQYVPEADKVVVLRDGRIAEAGTYADLIGRKGGILAEMMHDVQTDLSDDESEDAATKSGRISERLSEKLTISLPHPGPPGPSAPAAPAVAAAGGLTASESRATGVVSLDVLLAYARALGGVPAFLQLIALYVLIEVLRNAASVWLSVWTANTDAVDGGDGEPQREVLLRAVGMLLRAAHRASSSRALFYLAVFCGISLTQVLAAGVTQFRLRYLSLRAAENLHDGMLRCLLRAPMAFFHVNPSGRVTNRFTKDTSDIDRNLAFYAAMWFQSMLQLLSTAVVIGAVTPFVLPVLVPLLLLFGMLYLYFQASVREIKRLDSVARSPIFTAVSNALTGLPTIRSFRKEDTLRARTGALVDTSSVMQLASQSLNRWLSLRLEAVGAVVSFAAAALAIEQQGQAAWAGLTLSYALQMTALTTMTVRLASMAENSFNAVERVDEFSHVEPEGGPADDTPPPPGQSRAPSRVPSAAVLAEAAHARSRSAGPNGLDGEGSVLDGAHSAGYGGGDASDEEEGSGVIELPPGFPRYGEIQFEDAQMRYRPNLPLVLKGLTLTIEPGSTVGVVGRTGAGKSSVINALFRLTELCGGRVRVDGLDIARLRLAELRRAMALIPQHPTLFTGTLRSNLAPNAAHVCDDDLWGALRAAHLHEVVAAHPEGLDMRLVDNGAPLAQGQRQLVALARALLRRSRVLVLDEATANVDMETDALIQATIHNEFDGCTRIAVAHRLHTVIDCHKILVMDAGVAAEYDAPAALLADPSSIFSSMVNETGKATAAYLRGVAAGDGGAAVLPAGADVGGVATADSNALAQSRTASTVGGGAPPLSRSTSAAPNGLLVANQVLREAAEADKLLGLLVHYMEDKAQTEHMERQYAAENDFLPPAPSGLGADNPTDVAAQLSQVARLVCSVKGQLTSMRDRLEIPLSGFDVPAAQVGELPCADGATPPPRPSGTDGTEDGGAGGSNAFRRFRRVVSQVQTMQRGTRMLRRGEGSVRLREEAESNAASYM